MIKIGKRIRFLSKESWHPNAPFLQLGYLLVYAALRLKGQQLVVVQTLFSCLNNN